MNVLKGIQNIATAYDLSAGRVTWVTSSSTHVRSAPSGSAVSSR